MNESPQSWYWMIEHDCVTLALSFRHFLTIPQDTYPADSSTFNHMEINLFVAANDPDYETESHLPQIAVCPGLNLTSRNFARILSVLSRFWLDVHKVLEPIPCDRCWQDRYMASLCPDSHPMSRTRSPIELLHLGKFRTNCIHCNLTYRRFEGQSCHYGM